MCTLPHALLTVLTIFTIPIYSIQNGSGIIQHLLMMSFATVAICIPMVITPHYCTRGKVISSIVVVVIVVDTNFSISQHQGTCTACKRHIGVATGGKLAPAPSNQFKTTGVCSICRLSDAFCEPPFFAMNVKWRSPNCKQLYIYTYA